MQHSSVLEIDLSAVAHNMRLLQRIVGPECLLCPMIKADAYGLGALRIARSLTANGARMLAVYTPAQAVEMLKAALGVPVLVMMPVRDVDRVDELYRGLIRGQVQLSVHDADHLASIRALGERFGSALPVHLEVDTGMSRGGCPPQEAAALLKEIAAHPRLELAGLYTHFADAERDVARTDRQMKMLDDLIEANRDCIAETCVVHVANTFAALRAKRFHRSMVRIGLGWAGYGLEEMEGGESGAEIIAEGQDLRPALTWRSEIAQVRVVEAGTPVGYGSTWTAPRASVLGLVPIGYADGYPPQAGRRDEREQCARAAVVMRPDAGVAGRRFAPVVGAVNMDQIVLDLTDIAAAAVVADDDSLAPPRVGTAVELITPDQDAPNHLPRLAREVGTFSHELLCRLNPRIPRTYRVPLHGPGPRGPRGPLPAAGAEAPSTSSAPPGEPARR